MSNANLQIDSKTYIHAFQSVVNGWGQELNPTEFQTMLFIVERTLRFNKLEELIPIRHFIEGVQSKGEVIVGRVRSTRSAIVKAYKSLAERGLIRITKTDEWGGVNRFTIVVSKLVKGVGSMVSKLKQSKRRKAANPENTGGLSEAQGGSLSNTPGGLSGAQRNIQNSKQQKVKHRIDTRPAGEDSPLDAVTKAIETNKAKRKAKASSTKVSYETVSAAWREAVAQHHPGTTVPKLSPKEYKQIKQSLAATGSEVTPQAFLEWVVENWNDLVIYRFRWMTQAPPPAAPRADFVARFIRYFVQYHGERFAVAQDRRQKHSAEAKAANRAQRELEEAEAELTQLRQEKAKADRDKAFAEQRLERLVRERAKQRVQTEGDTVRVKDLTKAGEQDLGDDLPEWQS